MVNKKQSLSLLKIKGDFIFWELRKANSFIFIILIDWVNKTQRTYNTFLK